MKRSLSSAFCLASLAACLFAEDALAQTGHVGINTSNPVHTLHVIASTNDSTVTTKGIIARFDPIGGSNLGVPASILINGGRAILGYEIGAGTNKYAYLRGNQSTDIRLQTMDQNSVLSPNAFVIASDASHAGFIGINNELPQSHLDVRGIIKVLAGSTTQTGNLWNGTSSINGFEVNTNTTTGDAFVGVQRSGSGAPLYLTKPAGSIAGHQLLVFTVGGTAVGSVTYNGAGVQYNTTSDSRLKENLHASRYGLATVNAIKVYDYNFKSSKEKTLNTGVMAQELYKEYPQAVKKGGSDASTDPWQVDYSKLTPVLVKSIQELSGKVEALEKEKAELVAKVTELTSAADGLSKHEIKALKLLLANKESLRSENNAAK